ncbi:MAG: hypothetical protein OJF51_003978 [Nitrospira sp.]|nr:MAG: hypothetical protein OJF51_003978 [Nitrospira sp.]
MRPYPRSDLAECQREGTVLRYDISWPLKDQSGAWRNGVSLGLNDLES